MVSNRVRGDGYKKHEDVQRMKKQVLHIPFRHGDRGAGFPTLHIAFSFIAFIAGGVFAVAVKRGRIGLARALRQNVCSPKSSTPGRS
jgi:hypothetical protein